MSGTCASRSPRPLTIGIKLRAGRAVRNTWSQPRSHRSAYFRLIHPSWAAAIPLPPDLHQTEFGALRAQLHGDSSDPAGPSFPRRSGSTNQAWGEEIVAAWLAGSAPARSRRWLLNYTGVQAESFHLARGGTLSTTTRSTVEIQNKQPAHAAAGTGAPDGRTWRCA